MKSDIWICNILSIEKMNLNACEIITLLNNISIILKKILKKIIKLSNNSSVSHLSDVITVFLCLLSMQLINSHSTEHLLLPSFLTPSLHSPSLLSSSLPRKVINVFPPFPSSFLFPLFQPFKFSFPSNWFHLTLYCIYSINFFWRKNHQCRCRICMFTFYAFTHFNST